MFLSRRVEFRENPGHLLALYFVLGESRSPSKEQMYKDIGSEVSLSSLPGGCANIVGLLKGDET